MREGQENLGIGLNDFALDQIGTAGDTLSQAFDPRRWNSSQATGGPLDIGNFNQEVEDQTYQLATDRLSGEFDRSEESLRTRLANQGVNAGTEAFGHEMSAFNEGKGNAYANARLAARETALGQRGQELGERQQAIAEGEADYGRDYNADLAQRRVPLEEISAILNGTPLNPVSPADIYTRGVSDTDVAGITQNGFNNQMGIYNQQMSSRNALLGSVFGTAGAALGNPNVFR